MGTLDLLAGHLKEAALRNSTRILVAASRQNIDVLSTSASASILPALRVAIVEPHETIPDDLIGEISLLVVEVDPIDRASMQRISVIRAHHPNLLLVAAINGANVSLVRTLVREGINDVVSLPFDVDELLQVSLDAVAKRDAKAPQPVDLAPMVAVVRSIGGCGATTIATHLAADLASFGPHGRGAVIVDLDLQFGSVADFLGVKPRGNLADLLGVENRLDEELLRSVAVEAEGGLSVIAAPDAIMPLESVDTDDLLRVLTLLREQYDYVVLDLPANWTNWTLSAALAADAILMIVELSIPSLRQAKRRLELFRSVGIEGRAVEIVVNRVEKRLFRTIGVDDVAQTLSHRVLATVALDAPTVHTAQNQGALVGSIRRKSRFAVDLAEIGQQLRAGLLARSS
ncbi:AAA family ATPase [Novosphingobium sp. G106]|uniref:AAA family ATPase n=1 Tax=Novosphingobium sp. G106 TaxID=2849500 RepID=UPI001C2DD70E|nr:AAA family ATPase [Novosphingobium sp. G106]MBV1689326.1 AAA family ATPase [Novosphingobium sp. G106]